MRTFRWLAVVLIATLVLPLAPAAAQDSDTTTFRVRIANVSTPNTLPASDTATGMAMPVPLSPGAYAVYTGDDNPVFQVGTTAAEPLEILAEDGFPMALAQQLSGAAGVVDSGTFVSPPSKPAIQPMEVAEFLVTASPGQKLSFATMFVPSNDAFYGPADGIELFDGAEPISANVTAQIGAFDAGTEENQLFYGSATKPMQPTPDFGPDEDSTIQPVNQVAGPVTYPLVDQVLRVTVRPAFTANLDNVNVPAGYKLEAVTTGLDFPTGIAMSGGRTWVSEAGILPNDPIPQVAELDADGIATTILSATDLAEGQLIAPLVDVTYNDGMLYISHRQKGVNNWNVGAISRFDPDDPAGTFTTVVTNLPSSGDHHTNETVFDESGRLYFSQGTATNSSVVGPDNQFNTGWLRTFPEFHDYPAKDVTLSGVEYTSENVLTPDNPDDQAVTAPFMPFNSGAVDPGTVVPAATADAPQDGIIAGVGAAYSLDPNADDPASTMRLEAWGLRNPFGIGLDPFNEGTLFATSNGADVRSTVGPRRQEPGDFDSVEPVGNRPIAEDADDLFMFDVGGDEEFFGFPDYFHDGETGDVLPVTDPRFCNSPLLPADCQHDFVLEEQFRESLDPMPAFAQFATHSSANKFDFSTSDAFGFTGDLFVAETGSFVPTTGATEFTGYDVVRVDRDSGEVTKFLTNNGDTLDEVFEPTSFNKPIDVKFRDGQMYIVDFGVFEPGLDRIMPATGKVWVLSSAEAQSERVAGANRYATAAEIATATFPDGVTDVILATGERYPDALAASGLAGQLEAPVLLTDTENLSPETQAALDDLDPQTVHIAGGTVAVSQDVEDTLDAAGYDTPRFDGADRYETAAMIAEAIGANNVANDTAIIATGENFPDAVAGGPLAYAGPHPILLVEDEVPQATEDALNNLGIDEVIILGGTQAVSSDVETALESITGDDDAMRLGGATRFETAAEIADYAVTDAGFDLSTVLIANGVRNMGVDALAGGPHGGAIGSPILLVTEGAVPMGTASLLADSCAAIDTVRALGGRAVISEATLAEATALASCEQ